MVISVTRLCNFFEVRCNKFSNKRRILSNILGQWLWSRAVASITRVPLFESSHWHILFAIKYIENTKMRKDKKWPKNSWENFGNIFKCKTTMWLLVG